MLDPPHRRTSTGTQQKGRQLAVLTGLCLALALGTAPHLAAYPATPDGEPLHLESTQAYSSMAPDGLAEAEQRPLVSSPAEPPLLAVIASTETDASNVTAIVAAAGLAALAVLAAAFVLTGHRRHAAGAPLSRERS